jgi:hypothetical protein
MRFLQNSAPGGRIKTSDEGISDEIDILNLFSSLLDLAKPKNLFLNTKVINIYVLLLCLKIDFVPLFFLLKKAGGRILFFCGYLRLPAISFQYFTDEKG